MNDDDFHDVYALCLEIIEERACRNFDLFINENFYETQQIIVEESWNILSQLCMNDDDEENDDLQFVFLLAIDDFFEFIVPLRSSSHDVGDMPKDAEQIAKTLNYLNTVPQYAQRTEEWYELRSRIITASNMYKAFGSQLAQNSLIYEKCKGMWQEKQRKKIKEQDEEKEEQDEEKEDQVEAEQDEAEQVEAEDEEESKEHKWNGQQEQEQGQEEKDLFGMLMTNVNTPMHWGQRYEPVTVMVYEQVYATKVGDYGLIPHRSISFLGASPDGINVLPSSPRYGRMLEIKNIYNREITGMPKKEYWCQMQLQMEVCDLDICDFVETRFEEYATSMDFFNDSYVCEFTGQRNLFLTQDAAIKGCMLYFHNTRTQAPMYLYMPLHISTEEGMYEWMETEKEKEKQRTKEEMLFVRCIFWRLDEFSCVQVERNREWFYTFALPRLTKLWQTVLDEYQHDFQHRAPKRRTKANTAAAAEKTNFSSSCSLLSRKTCSVVVNKLN